jgi:hypothetical protein
MSPEVERLGRRLIRLTVEAAPQDSGHTFPRRGFRRIEWIESTLRPLRQQLGPTRWRKLVAALAMIVGWEALIVQRDICGLSASEGEALSIWAARALMQAALQEARGSRNGRNTRKARR